MKTALHAPRTGAEESGARSHPAEGARPAAWALAALIETLALLGGMTWLMQPSGIALAWRIAAVAGLSAVGGGLLTWYLIKKTRE
jgi:hypothetical protein